jgi:hypothetical protein
MHIDIDPQVLARVRAAQSSVVVAGHFSLAENMQELSHEGDAEVQSFAAGVHLVQQARYCGCDSRVVVWINDIGVPNEVRQQLKQAARLPDNYREIVAQARLAERDVVVIFESTMRNRASVLARKLFKWEPDLFEKVNADSADLVRCVSNHSCDIAEQGNQSAYVVEGPDGERLVVKEGPNPKCNMILATLFLYLKDQYAPKLILNVFNDIYAYRLSLGVHVSQAIIGNPTPTANVFCDGERIYRGATDCLFEEEPA